MVLLLPLDIRRHGIHVAVAHAERAIPVLPCEMMERTPRLLVNPSCGAGFHRTNNLRQTGLFAQKEQDMHVICSSTHLYGRTPVVVEYLCYICVHLRQVVLGYRVRTTLGRKHEVDVYLC